MTQTASGTAWGKIILLGEHAVVMGHPALAAALDRCVVATATPTAERPARLSVPAWDVDTARDPQGSPARAFRALGAHLNAPTYDVHVRANVPPRAGLGSSAALSVAVARALSAATGRPLDAAGLTQAAQAAEAVFHERPSGVDVALATHGGLGTFTRGNGFVPLAVGPFSVAIGLSGVSRDTAARVRHVADLRERDPHATDAVLHELGALAQKGADLLLAGPAIAIGPLMNRADALLVSLGLGCAELDALCNMARDAGATGAKLTGAGGGGAAIAVGHEQRVVDAWRAAGFEAFIATIGAMP